MSRDLPGVATNNIQIGDVSPIDITGTALTIAFWIQVDTFPAASILVDKGNGVSTSGKQYETYLGGGGTKLSFECGDSGGVDTVNGATSLSAGVWHHCTAVKNGTGAGAMKVYLDGVQDGSATSNRSIQNTGELLYFGRRNIDDWPFNGRIAEVAIWNVSLGAEEAAALAKGVSPLLVRPGSGLKAYWPLYGVAFGEPDLSGGASHAGQNGTIPKGEHSPSGPPILP